MPLPRTKDVGVIIRFLKREKPNMPVKQRLAIALEHARRMGNKKIKYKSPRIQALQEIKNKR